MRIIISYDEIICTEIFNDRETKLSLFEKTYSDSDNVYPA